MKKLTVLLLLLILASATFAQRNDEEIRFWRLTSFSGELGLRGLYRNLTSTINEGKDRQHSSMYGGIFSLRTSSYFWTPRFLIIQADGEFNPEKSTDNYLAVPDQAEVRTLGRLGISTLFFAQKPLSLTLFGHLDQGYSNRENLTSLKTDNKDFGGLLTFSNKVLPARFSYKRSWSKVNEIPGQRIYDIRQENYMASVSRNFGAVSKNELIYTHDAYVSRQYQMIPVSVISDNLSLSNQVVFDRNQQYKLNSFMSALNQARNQRLRRYQVVESLSLRLPRRLNVYGNYSFYRYEWLQSESDQHNAGVRFDHKLYESLNSSIFTDYTDTRHSLYRESVSKGGIDLMYQKKIPGKGLLTLAYRYERQHRNQVSDAVELELKNEPYTLTDGKFVLLDKAYVTIASIFVTDLTGAIVYQPNLDYLVIPWNNFTEIRRIPGGQIANNAVVLVSYTATQPGSYRYDVNAHNVSASLIFFNRLLELYYRYMERNYVNLHQAEYLTIDYLHQHIYGVKLAYRMASAGAEYDDYQSTLVPYKMVHYYVTLQGDIRNRVMYSLTGNIRTYKLTGDDVIQKYNDVTGNISYGISTNTRFNLNMSYWHQTGTGIDLKLLNARLECVTGFRKIYISAGLDLYRRTYLDENLFFEGGSLKIYRKF